VISKVRGRLQPLDRASTTNGTECSRPIAVWTKPSAAADVRRTGNASLMGSPWEAGADSRFAVVSGCNLDAVDRIVALHHPEVVSVESGGDNLSATFSPEPSDLTLYVIDVAGGAKVPHKGGPGLTKADLLVITQGHDGEDNRRHSAGWLPVPDGSRVS
jgi:hypothetical protein